jgi:hypothetical protein
LNTLGDHAWGARASRIYEEFNDASDFVWKAPRLIEMLTDEERGKLDSYFPLVGEPEKGIPT